jgi:hypothetical protein
MLLFPARKIGGLEDEVRHGQKTKKFSGIFPKILSVNISASEQIIEKKF